jgi:hypothetical protein
MTDWIPCSERMPDDYQEVLVTCRHSDGRIRIYMNWSHFNEWCFHREDGDEMLAWMPLPEPYKGEQK